MRVLVPAEIERLLAASRGTPLETLIEVALATGMRRAEALALKWSSVDVDGRTLSITENARFEPGQGVTYGPPKSRKSRRTLALSAETTAVLRALRQSQRRASMKLGTWGNDDDLVFTNEVGEPLALGSFNARFNRIVAAAGLEVFGFTTCAIPTAPCSPAPASTPNSRTATSRPVPPA